MRKITMFLLALFLFGFIGSSFIQVEASTHVSYEVTGVFDTGGTWVGLTGSGTRGNTVSFALTSVPAGHDFVFWIVNGVVRRDLPGAYEHTLTTTNDLQIIFAPTNKYAAVFIDLNNKFIGVEYTTGSIVLDSELVMPLARPGFVVDTLNKWTSIAGSSTLADVQAHSVFVLNYEEAVTPVGAVTLSVTNGSYSVSNPVPFNSLVTATADAAPSEQVFAGWEENGVIVSYNPQYQFTALYNRTLVATYAASVTTEPNITLSNALSLRDGYYTYVGQFDIPGFNLVEYGFIFHPTVSSDLTLDTSGITVAQSTNRQAITNEYITSFAIDAHRSIKAYAIVNDGVDTIVIYSKNYISLGYHFDFESTTKSPSGYGAGEFVIPNLNTSLSFDAPAVETQHTTSSNAPHDTQGRFLVTRPKSLDSMIEFDFQENISLISFRVAIWSAADYGRINEMVSLELQVWNEAENRWDTIVDFLSLISNSTEYFTVTATNLYGSKYRIYAVQNKSGGANGDVRICIDDFYAYTSLISE